MKISPNKKNFTVIKDFTIEGMSHLKGETWHRPDDWRVDNDFTELYHMRAEGKDVQAVAFLYDVQVGMERQRQDNGQDKMVPTFDSKRMILPVK